MSPHKRKGTTFETLIVRYLQTVGFPYAERRALHGNLDKGDITGCGPVVFEVKNHAKLTLSEWIKELEAEVENAKADTGCVVAKRRGKSNPGEWYALLPFEWFVELLKEIGY